MDNTGLIFRNLQDKRDYPLLLELNRSSRQADNESEPVTLEIIAQVIDNMAEPPATQGVVIASLAGIPVGYSRLGWYSSRPETRLYYQISFLRKEYRQSNVWSLMIAENEHRLHQMNAGHSSVPERFFQAWASDYQKDWIAALESTGYQVVRRFNNMIYRIGEIPDKPLPAGLEVRPVQSEQMHSVWEAQKEMNQGLFENVAEDWLDEKYPEWLADPANNPRLWQVAWDGDRLVGMVLAHYDEQDNEKRNRKHGYTEHIYVRPAWRGRGLASALITRSLFALKSHGITEAELGVDSENESAAFRLYQNLGYQTYSVDIWYRKSMG